MPKYLMEYRIIETRTYTYTLSAKDESEAEAKAEELLNKIATDGKRIGNLEDTEREIELDNLDED